MNDLNPNRLSPADEDPLVHRYLAALPRYEPVEDFPDRVLLNVWRPLPPRIRALQEGISRARWPWVVLGVMAVGSFTWQLAAITALAQHPEWRVPIANWIRDEGRRWLGTGWDAAFTTVSHATAPLLSAQTAPWAAAALGVMLVCALGLYLVTRSASPAHGGPHGAH